MWKKLCILMLIVLIIIGVSFGIIVINKRIRIKKEQIAIKEKEGITLVFLAGSNYLSKGNKISEGYLIKTKNGQVIVVDGGRDSDAEELSYYINKYGNGVVDHWYITHGHCDHVGALTEILNNEKYKDIKIKNLYHSLLLDDWYKENDDRGYPSEHAIIKAIEENNEQIENVIMPKKGEKYVHDNIESQILRIANPEITHSDNGNDSGLVWKFNITDINKSMIFLGDAYFYTSKELMENPEILKADYVQMAHHGQNGVSREVYEAIKPIGCFFNCPEWLYNNDCGRGYNSGGWKTIETKKMMEEIGATEFYKAFEGTQIFKINSDGINRIVE